MDNQTLLDGFAVGEKFRAFAGIYPATIKSPMRCAKEADGNVFVYAHRKKRFGWRFDRNDFLNTWTIVPPKNETEEWHKRLRRAVKCMHESGLWPEIKERFENALKMTWEDRLEMVHIYRNKGSWSHGKYVAKTAEEMDAAWQPFSGKYPFAFTVTSDGHLSVDTDYLFEVSECRLKSMYFGKRLNKDIKAELKYAIEDRRPWSQDRIRTGYDVSVSYDPGKQKAWYSEEYRGCGNGHYYAMLDQNTALFLEDD